MPRKKTKKKVQVEVKTPVDVYQDLWNMQYILFLGWKDHEFDNWCVENLHFQPESSGKGGLCLYGNGSEGDVCCVWVKRKNDHGTIAHECLHAAMETLSARGVKCDYDNPEPLTYLHGWIVDKCYEAKK